MLHIGKWPFSIFIINLVSITVILLKIDTVLDRKLPKLQLKCLFWFFYVILSPFCFNKSGHKSKFYSHLVEWLKNGQQV